MNECSVVLVKELEEQVLILILNRTELNISRPEIISVNIIKYQNIPQVLWSISDMEPIRGYQ